MALSEIVLALYTYWPRQYDKGYLKTPISTEVNNIPLKKLADSIGFKIGVATSLGSEYHALIAEEFNSIVGEGHFKPSKLLTDAANWKFDFSNADELMEFAESNGIRMRGYALIWGKFAGRTYPKYWGKQVTEASDKKQVMEAIMTGYLNTTMSHFKGRVSTWDEVNEPMDGLTLFPSPFTEALGEEYIDLAFRLARDADPECSLFLNEQIGDYDGPSGKAFLSLLERLKARNVPIDGVGLQSHHLNRWHDLDALKRYIRAIGKLG